MLLAFTVSQLFINNDFIIFIIRNYTLRYKKRSVTDDTPYNVII